MESEVVNPKRGHQMRKAKGRFFNRPTISKGKKYDKFFIYIPTEVARDTNFPFKNGERIEVEIVKHALEIKKVEETS